MRLASACVEQLPPMACRTDDASRTGVMHCVILHCGLRRDYIVATHRVHTHNNIQGIHAADFFFLRTREEPSLPATSSNPVGTEHFNKTRIEFYNLCTCMSNPYIYIINTIMQLLGSGLIRPAIGTYNIPTPGILFLGTLGQSVDS